MKKFLFSLGGGLAVFGLVLITPASAENCPEGMIPEEFEIGIKVSSKGELKFSEKILEQDKTYLIKASETYRFANWVEAGIADASCSLRLPNILAPNTETDWVLGSDLDSPYENYLELFINGNPAGWGGCNEEHIYMKQFVGEGNKIKFNIKDNVYGDNYGDLNVDIYQCVDNDEDGDSVLDKEDKCRGTSFDEPEERLGVNRHIWKDQEGWVGYFTTLVPSRRGNFSEVSSKFSIKDTYGCSCFQILNEFEVAGLGKLVGHRNFGCSKSVMEDFSKDFSDGVIDGRYLIETVEVPANQSVNKSSTETLFSGVKYILRARGLADAGDTIDFDALCSKTNRIADDSWTDLVSGYTSYGETLLDLFVNNSNALWGDECTNDHEYWAEMDGNDSPASFRIYDIYPSNNRGSLFVDIYAQL